LWSPKTTPPREPRQPTIQLPYCNKFETIWEYEESFLSGQIDFVFFIGVRCPICGREDCYRPMGPYWRYAIELFPEFKKKRIPIARFVCRQRRKTFSLLPIQLIPYVQYTVGAVMGTLLLGMGSWQMGQKGFHGASMAVDPESLLTPWLITCWLVAVIRGLRRGHTVLRRLYNLDGVRTLETAQGWQEAADYFVAFGLEPKMDSHALWMDVVGRYSRSTGQFLFGTPSQYRRSLHP
jgi:hypothetical protein